MVPDRKIYAADSGCLIEWLKPPEERQHPPEVAGGMSKLIEAVKANKCRFVLSAMALAEVRKLNEKQREKFDALCARGYNPAVIAVDAQIALRAAHLGEAARLKPVDAVHLVTAIVAKAVALFTTDKGLLRVDARTILLKRAKGKPLAPPAGFSIKKPHPGFFAE